MKVWFGLIGLLVGLAIGVAGTIALTDPVRLQPEERQDVAAVPSSCLEAIAAARDRLLLNPDVLETLRDYRDLAADLGDELSRMQVPNLRATLGELNDLRDRSDELIQRSANAGFSAAASECEAIAEERGAAPVPTS